MYATACVWMSEDNFKESVLSFYHVGSRNGTQVIRIGSKAISLDHVINSYNVNNQLVGLCVSKCG